MEEKINERKIKEISSGAKRRKWQPTPVFLPGKFHGQRNLMGYSSWGRKELDTAEYTRNKELMGSKAIEAEKRVHLRNCVGKESR